MPVAISIGHFLKNLIMKKLTNFEQLRKLQTSLAANSSVLKKKELLTEYKETCNTEFCEKVFSLIFDDSINFHITSDRVLGLPAMYSFEKLDYGEEDIFGFFQTMSQKTGAKFDDIYHCRSIYNNLKDYDKGVAELFLNILDKDFKCGTNLKTIASVFPNIVKEFKVALANKYFGNEKLVNFNDGTWRSSRKMDGCRCIAIVNGEGVCETISRQGKKFETTSRIERELEDACRAMGLTNVVFDGECCIVDQNGDEHFDWIMKEIKRKNHTIERPMYQIFDMLTTGEFYGITKSPVLDERQERLAKFFENRSPKYLKKVEQTKITCQEDFDRLYKEAMTNGWEGLIIRKNVPYENKRSNNMLKCKSFNDAEYVVTGYHTGDMRFVENGAQVTRNVLTDVTIVHKGYEVSVGSGFSKEQRIRYKENPELVLGKTITVQYFEETTDKNGELSLRFPTVKQVYENGRDV